MDNTTLDNLASQMDPTARELAHSAWINGAVDTPDDMAREYVLSVAEVCGARAVGQCADGEAWKPADYLAGDWHAITEAAALVGVDAGDIKRNLWQRYTAPSESALRAL